MALKDLTTRQLLLVYNAMAADAVGKFEDKKAAIRRTTAMLEAAAEANQWSDAPEKIIIQFHADASDEQLLEIISNQYEKVTARIAEEIKAAEVVVKAVDLISTTIAIVDPIEEPNPLPIVEAPVVKEGKPKGPGRGRVSQFAGMVAFAKRPMNHRYPGSVGFKSFSILIEAGQNGVSYKEFIAKGGRSKDLAWDVEHNYARVEKAV